MPLRDLYRRNSARLGVFVCRDLVSGQYVLLGGNHDTLTEEVLRCNVSAVSRYLSSSPMLHRLREGARNRLVVELKSGGGRGKNQPHGSPCGRPWESASWRFVTLRDGSRVWQS